MQTHPLVIGLAILVVAATLGVPTSTQAAEIGGGVEIRPADGPNGAYAQVGNDGRVSIQLDSDAGVSGAGVPADALLRFDRVFLLLNTNEDDQQAFVYVTDNGPAAESLDFYTTTTTERTSIEGTANATRLATGEAASIGFALDTTDRVDGTLTLTVEAEVSERAAAALSVDTAVPVAGDPLVFNASASTGDALTYDYAFGDGTVSEHAGPTTTHSYVEAGTYHPAVTIEETSPRVPNETATTNTQVVVAKGTARTRVNNTARGTIDNSSNPFVEIRVASTVPASGAITATTFAAESTADIADGNSPNNPTVAVTDIVVPPAQENADATITFVIDDSILPADTSASNLVVERYDGTSWDVLPTTLIDENPTDGTLTIAVETPGFSPFAVTIGQGTTPDSGDSDGDDDAGGGAGGVSGVDSTTTSSPASTPATPDPTSAPTVTSTPTTPDSTPASTATSTPDATPAPSSETVTEASTEASRERTTQVTLPGEPGGFDLLPVLALGTLTVVLALVALVRRRLDE